MWASGCGDLNLFCLPHTPKLDQVTNPIPTDGEWVLCSRSSCLLNGKSRFLFPISSTPVQAATTFHNIDEGESVPCSFSSHCNPTFSNVNHGFFLQETRVESTDSTWRKKTLTIICFSIYFAYGKLIGSQSNDVDGCRGLLCGENILFWGENHFPESYCKRGISSSEVGRWVGR